MGKLGYVPALGMGGEIVQDDREKGLVALEVAGFWRRLIAFAVDGILLGIAGMVAGLLFFDALAALDLYARLLGFLVALLYFGVLNSRVGHGQTLGKRLLGVRVVEGGDKLLSLPRSLLRYSVLGVPFFLNGAPLAMVGLASPATYLLSVAVFGGIFAIVYLYVFNRRTRRSLHDLVSGSWVVRAHPFPGALPDGRVWRGHLVVVALIFAASLAIPALAGRLSQQGMFQDLSEVQQVLSREPGVRRVSVKLNFSLGESEPSRDSITAVVVVGDGSQVLDAALAERLATKIHDQYPDMDALEHVVVVLSYGYDMAFASAWRSKAYKFGPSGSTDTSAEGDPPSDDPG